MRKGIVTSRQPASEAREEGSKSRISRHRRRVLGTRIRNGEGRREERVSSESCEY